MHTGATDRPRERRERVIDLGRVGLARGAGHEQYEAGERRSPAEALELLRGVSRAIRALSVFELVVAGDLGDRGPRTDAVIEALRAGTTIDKIFIQKGETDKTLGHIASTARAAAWCA